MWQTHIFAHVACPCSVCEAKRRKFDVHESQKRFQTYPLQLPIAAGCKKALCKYIVGRQHFRLPDTFVTVAGNTFGVYVSGVMQSKISDIILCIYLSEQNKKTRINIVK